MASQHPTRSILVTLSNAHWSALIEGLSIHTERANPVIEAAVRAFIAQIAFEAVRAPYKNGNGHERRA